MLKIKRLFFLFCLFFLVAFADAQTEKLNYTVYFHWGPIWIDGGDMVLQTERVDYQGEEVVKLTGLGISAEKWKWLFEINDHYISWCRKGDFLPLETIKDAYEAGEKTDNHYIFDYRKSQVYIQTKNNESPIKKDTLTLDRPIYDAQCATAWLRYLDFEKLKTRDTIHLNVLLDGALYRQEFLIFKGEELLDQSGKHYEVLKFTAMMPENNLFSSTEAIRVWVTNDSQRLPLKIKADLKVGSIEVLYDNIRFKKPGN